MSFQETHSEKIVSSETKKPSIPNYILKNPLREDIFVSSMILSFDGYFSKYGKITVEIGDSQILLEDNAGAYEKQKSITLPLTNQLLPHQKKVKVFVWNEVNNSEIIVTVNTKFSDQPTASTQVSESLSLEELNKEVSDSGISSQTQFTLDKLDQLLSGINGIDMGDVNLNTVPITDKLTEVKNAIDSVNTGVTNISISNETIPQAIADITTELIDLANGTYKTALTNIKTALTNLSDGFDLDELQSLISVMNTNIPNITNDKLKMLLATLKIQLEIISQSSELKPSTNNIVFPKRVYRNETLYHILNMKGFKNLLLMMAGTSVPTPVKLTNTNHNQTIPVFNMRVLRPTSTIPAGFDLVWQNPTRNVTSNGVVRQIGSQKYITDLPNYANYTESTFPYINSESTVKRMMLISTDEESVDIDLKTDYSTYNLEFAFAFGNRISSLFNRTFQSHITYFKTNSDNTFYDNVYSHFLSKSIHIPDLKIEESDNTNFTNKTTVKDFGDSEYSDGNKSQALTKRYCRITLKVKHYHHFEYNVATSSLLNGVPNVKNTINHDGNYQNADTVDISSTAYSKSFGSTSISSLMDNLRTSGISYLSIEIKDAFDNWHSYITASQIGTVTAGNNVIASYGQSIGAKPLPSTQDSLRLKLQIASGGMETAVSVIRIA